MAAKRPEVTGSGQRPLRRVLAIGRALDRLALLAVVALLACGGWLARETLATGSPSAAADRLRAVQTLEAMLGPDGLAADLQAAASDPARAGQRFERNLGAARRAVAVLRSGAAGAQDRGLDTIETTLARAELAARSRTPLISTERAIEALQGLALEPQPAAGAQAMARAPAITTVVAASLATAMLALSLAWHRLVLLPYQRVASSPPAPHPASSRPVSAAPGVAPTDETAEHARSSPSAPEPVSRPAEVRRRSGPDAPAARDVAIRRSGSTDAPSPARGAGTRPGGAPAAEPATSMTASAIGRPPAADGTAPTPTIVAAAGPVDGAAASRSDAEPLQEPSVERSASAAQPDPRPSPRPIVRLGAAEPLRPTGGGPGRRENPWSRGAGGPPATPTDAHTSGGAAPGATARAVVADPERPVAPPTAATPPSPSPVAPDGPIEARGASPPPTAALREASSGVERADHPASGDRRIEDDLAAASVAGGDDPAAPPREEPARSATLGTPPGPLRHAVTGGDSEAPQSPGPAGGDPGGSDRLAREALAAAAPEVGAEGAASVARALARARNASLDPSSEAELTRLVEALLQRVARSET